jgi:hypothetical protein
LFFNCDFLAEIAAILGVWTALESRFVLVALLSVPMMASGSRVALLSAGVGFACVSPLLALGAGALAIVMTTLLAPDKMASALDRLVIWRAAVTGITVFGNGLGSFTAAYPFWEYAHSDFLQFSYELGVGVLPFVVVLALALRTKQIPIRAALGCLATQFVVAFPLHLPATTFVAGVLVGHVARRRSSADMGQYVGGIYAGAAA